MRMLSRKLASLAVFRGAAALPAVERLRACLRELSADAPEEERLLDAYAGALDSLRQAGTRALSACVRAYLLEADTPYARAVASGAEDARDDADAARDLAILNELCALPARRVKDEILARCALDAAFIDALPEWEVGQPLDLRELKASYRQNGCGIFSRARAFRWERGELCAVELPERVEPLIGYDWQREAVMQNTRALLAGKPCCNVLLHGESGTGKSATVKSLLYVPEFFNLRIIEVAKNSLEELTALSQQLRTQTQKFILYIDDLSFREDDPAYSALKTALEGGLACRTENVAVYVTSNRRHMVRESAAERGTDALHRAETIAEQTSLADRFGLSLPYLALNQADFLTMVDTLATRAAISLEAGSLREKALAWSLRRGSRTPRTAVQFIEYLRTQGN